MRSIIRHFVCPVQQRPSHDICRTVQNIVCHVVKEEYLIMEQLSVRNAKVENMLTIWVTHASPVIAATTPMQLRTAVDTADIEKFPTTQHLLVRIVHLDKRRTTKATTVMTVVLAVTQLN
jgi:hypothetical protein